MKNVGYNIHNNTKTDHFQYFSKSGDSKEMGTKKKKHIKSSNLFLPIILVGMYI